MKNEILQAGPRSVGRHIVARISFNVAEQTAFCDSESLTFILNASQHSDIPNIVYPVVQLGSPSAFSFFGLEEHTMLHNRN